MTTPDDEALWWQQILDVARNLPRPVQHPQYIEGTLYVTPEQSEALKEIGQRRVCDPVTEARLLDILGIPVYAMCNDEVVTLPSGKSLMYSKTLSSLLIFDGRLLP